MALKPISVSQLNDYIGRVIGTDPLLGAVAVSYTHLDVYKRQRQKSPSKRKAECMEKWEFLSG